MPPKKKQPHKKQNPKTSGKNPATVTEIAAQSNAAIASFLNQQDNMTEEQKLEQQEKEKQELTATLQNFLPYISQFLPVAPGMVQIPNILASMGITVHSPETFQQTPVYKTEVALKDQNGDTKVAKLVPTPRPLPEASPITIDQVRNPEHLEKIRAASSEDKLSLLRTALDTFNTHVISLTEQFKKDEEAKYPEYLETLRDIERNLKPYKEIIDGLDASCGEESIDSLLLNYHDSLFVINRFYYKINFTQKKRTDESTTLSVVYAIKIIEHSDKLKEIDNKIKARNPSANLQGTIGLTLDQELNLCTEIQLYYTHTRKDSKKADIWEERVNVLSKENPETLITRAIFSGRVSLDKGETAKAIQHFENAINASPSVKNYPTQLVLLFESKAGLAEAYLKQSKNNKTPEAQEKSVQIATANAQDACSDLEYIVLFANIQPKIAIETLSKASTFLRVMDELAEVYESLASNDGTSLDKKLEYSSHASQLRSGIYYISSQILEPNGITPDKEFLDNNDNKMRDLANQLENLERERTEHILFSKDFIDELDEEERKASEKRDASMQKLLEKSEKYTTAKNEHDFKKLQKSREADRSTTSTSQTQKPKTTPSKKTTLRAAHEAFLQGRLDNALELAANAANEAIRNNDPFSDIIATNLLCDIYMKDARGWLREKSTKGLSEALEILQKSVLPFSKYAIERADAIAETALLKSSDVELDAAKEACLAVSIFAEDFAQIVERTRKQFSAKQSAMQQALESRNKARDAIIAEGGREKWYGNKTFDELSPIAKERIAYKDSEHEIADTLAQLELDSKTQREASSYLKESAENQFKGYNAKNASSVVSSIRIVQGTPHEPAQPKKPKQQVPNVDSKKNFPELKKQSPKSTGKMADTVKKGKTAPDRHKPVSASRTEQFQKKKEESIRQGK